jgi:hypothetical protein
MSNYEKLVNDIQYNKYFFWFLVKLYDGVD